MTEKSALTGIMKSVTPSATTTPGSEMKIVNAGNISHHQKKKKSSKEH